MLTLLDRLPGLLQGTELENIYIYVCTHTPHFLLCFFLSRSAYIGNHEFTPYL